MGTAGCASELSPLTRKLPDTVASLQGVDGPRLGGQGSVWAHRNRHRTQDKHRQDGVTLAERKRYRLAKALYVQKVQSLPCVSSAISCRQQLYVT